MSGTLVNGLEAISIYNFSAYARPPWSYMSSRRHPFSFADAHNGDYALRMIILVIVLWMQD